MQNIFSECRRTRRCDARDDVSAVAIISTVRWEFQVFDLDVQRLFEHSVTYKRKTVKHKSEPLSESHHQIAEPHGGKNEEDIRLLFDAIATLSSLNKAIILLYLENMSYEEIASITGLTKSNVSVRLVRIKKELELRLK